MGQMRLEDAQEFARTWMRQHETGGSARDVADELGLAQVRDTFARRRRVEKVLGIRLPTLGKSGGSKRYTQYLPRGTEQLTWDKPPTPLIASDLHFWPDHQPFAWWVLLEAVKVIKPDVCILNGDIFDFPAVSRFERRGWEERPSVAEEMDWAERKMSDLTQLCRRRRIKQYLTVGNHDIRFERYLAKNAPEMEGLEGDTLQDQIKVFGQGWELFDGLFINAESKNPIMIRHVIRAGIHDAYNSTLHGGCHTCTGHTHHLSAKHKADYVGVRWGLTSGFVGEPRGPQFEYVEGSPVDWVPGFIAIHVDDGHFSFDLFPVVGDKARVYGKTYHREDYPCN